MDKSKTKRRKLPSIVEANGELVTARAAYAALAPQRQQIDAARLRVQRAEADLNTARSILHLRTLVNAALALAESDEVGKAEQPILTRIERGGKLWLEGARNAALVFHAPQRGVLAFGCGGYRQMHGAGFAEVRCIMFGPTRAGFWYRADGAIHWHAVGGNPEQGIKRERFSLRLPDGRMIPVCKPAEQDAAAR